MPDYNQLRELCRNVNSVSIEAIDNFLVHHAARVDKLDDQFFKRFSRFRSATSNMPPEWVPSICMQYLAHRIFREHGLISKYLNQSAVKALGQEPLEFLQRAARRPWRFSFSSIVGKPAADFYEMKDVFSGDIYLLYSPSTTTVLKERPVLLWFNLVAFNGECWQTFGPITAFQGFDADDVFFYASELDAGIRSETDLLSNLDNNPVPYMMLMAGSNYPLIQSRGFEVVQVVGDCFAPPFDMEPLKREFRIEQAGQIFKLSHAQWSDIPHFAEAFYDAQRQLMLLHAMTDAGYAALGDCLRGYGLHVPEAADIRVHQPILTLIRTLYKKDVELNPYGRHFKEPVSPESASQVKQLNELLQLAMPYINSEKPFDIDALAKQAGVDPETAKDVLRQVMGQMGKV